MKTISQILIILLCVSAGFFAGRCTSKVETKTEYTKGDPVNGSVTNIEPILTETLEIHTLPVVIDTIYVNNIQYVVQKVDTAAIIREYELKRYYTTTLFDDKNGRLDINSTLQYNKLSDLTYTFTPVFTVKTVKVKPVWIPFISASYSTLYNQVSVGGGLFYHNIGIQIRYSTDFKVKGLDMGLLYKF
ncbi:MAG: hypothetical protein LBU37_02285 [Tannerellaceae bacterium]|jgi:hypothetical protein|nr:hypothetical protein [Tannerellaceae bacterium]